MILGWWMSVGSLAFLFVQAITGIISESDAITDERRYGYVISQDDNVLFLGCPAAGEKRDFSINLIPKSYYGSRSEALFEPNATHRFDNSEPVSGGWVFLDNHLSHFRLFGRAVKRDAEFVDSLVRSRKLAIRYEAFYGQPKTIVFNYEIDAGDIRRVMQVCAPPKLTEYLKELNSPAIIESPKITGEQSN